MSRFCFVADSEEVPLFYTNYDLTNIVTPVNVPKFEELLEQSNYDIKNLNSL